MSAATHTPGPWKVHDRRPIRACIHVSDQRGYDIASCYTAPSDNSDPDAEGIYRNDPERMANASLIAAAPDLLAVVRELEESAGYWSEYDVPLGIVDRIRAAIAKAEGRS